MSTTHHLPYAINITWSDEDDGYIATVPALTGCMSHGDTIEEAGANIQEAMEGWLACATAHGDPIPEPDRAMDDLRRFAPVINLSALARRAGVNKHTLATKIRRGTRFTPEEAKKIRAALPV